MTPNPAQIQYIHSLPNMSRRKSSKMAAAKSENPGEHFDVNQYLGSKGKTVTIKSKFEPPKTDSQKKGHKGIVDLLMPLKQKGQRGKIDDAILLAASLGHLDIVKMCQAKGADTEIRDPETGATPLINAAKGGHESTVMHLVDTKGADINASTTNDQSTALHMAAAGGFFGVAQCLVFKGCDVFAKSKNGTALDVAQKNDHQKIVALLKPIINNHHNHQNKYFRACTKGDLEEVKASLKEMKKEGLGKKKESKAVEAEKKALAKESGVPADGTPVDDGKPANMKEVDVQDPDGRTGLMLAGMNGHMNVVEYLFKEGAKIDLMDSEGFTALMLSAVNRHRPVVEFLLSHKADVTAQCKYGTALDIMLDLYN